MSKLPTYDIEESIRKKGYDFVAGVDEAGRGPGAGPVVAAAVRIPDYYIGTVLGKVNDSKKLSASKREALYDIITYNCDYGIGAIDNKIIDEINILEATKLAMRQAVNSVKFVNYVLVDGNFKITGLDIPQKSIIKGDNLSLSIACASIVAKVIRDELMKTLHYAYPIYGFLKHKGYLTREHIEMLKLYGPCEFHRRSFSKVGK